MLTRARGRATRGRARGAMGTLEAKGGKKRKELGRSCGAQPGGGEWGEGGRGRI